MTIVAAGARADLGQQAEAVRMLREAVTGPAPRRTGPALTRGAAAQAVEQEHQAAARLRYAYADALLQTGATEEARRMFAEAAKRDPEQLTDAQQRLDELDGLTLDLIDLDELDAPLAADAAEDQDEADEDDADDDDADEDDADEDDADEDDADDDRPQDDVEDDDDQQDGRQDDDSPDDDAERASDGSSPEHD
jgi:hypothetical protein